MTTKQKCICVTETSRDPNRVRELADQCCQLCRGVGELTVRAAHEAGQPREIAIYEAWHAEAAGVDVMGYGGTRKEAIADLMVRLEEVSN